MATHRISVLNSQSLADNSGDVFSEPADVKGTNGFFKHGVLVFNDSGNDDEIFISWDVPQNYVGTAGFRVIWTTTATTGDWEAGIAYRAVGGDDSESLDQTTAQESLLSGNNFTAPSATDERMSDLISLTDANFAAGDTAVGMFSREGADAGDGISAAIQCRLYFEYADA